jgi:hypothetical protein
LNVNGSHRPRGETLNLVRVSSHESTTGLGGSTVSAAATDSSSIGIENSIVTGSFNPRSAENLVVKAACARGRIGVVRVATVGAG